MMIWAEAKYRREDRLPILFGPRIGHSRLLVEFELESMQQWNTRHQTIPPWN